MVRYLVRETGRAEDVSRFRNRATEDGLPGDRVLQFCEILESIVREERIVDSDRCLRFIEKNHNVRDWPEGEILLRLVSWKFQGTDGIRGVVAPDPGPAVPAGEGKASEPVNSLSGDPNQAVRAFLDNGYITPAFCALYVSAFVFLLEEKEGQISGLENPESKEAPEPSRTIVLGEDGRDSLNGTGIKKAMVEELLAAGYAILDLGTVPTPYLAAFTLRFDVPGIMLTASHNPSEYNGIKLFLRGRKLYPETSAGQYPGEYLLSAAVFSLADGGAERMWGAESGKLIRIEPTGDILAHLDSLIDLPSLKRRLREQPLLLDTANGAFSELAGEWLTRADIPFIPLSSTPARGMINRDSGIGELEDLSSYVSPGDPALPRTVKELLRYGRERRAEQMYALVLDGDGDRGFFLEYDGEEDRVRIFDGDDIGYFLIRGKKETLNGENRKLYVRRSVESNAACIPAAEEKWGRLESELTCVGDRWLVRDLPDTLTEDKGLGDFIGFERSGHVIFPVIQPEFLHAERVMEMQRTLHAKREEALMAGNGFLTVMTALQHLPLGTKEIGFHHGFLVRKVLRGVNFDLFYRGSSAWKKVLNLVPNMLPRECSEVKFAHEPDLLFFRLAGKQRDDTEQSVGHFFIRKSGTEPKMTVTLAMASRQCPEGEVVVEKIVERIAPLLR